MTSMKEAAAPALTQTLAPIPHPALFPWLTSPPLHPSEAPACSLVLKWRVVSFLYYKQCFL